MDRLHELEVFIAVARAGSFAKAGRRLRMSPPAVTRAISSLEARLGARVFNRTTRSLAITEAGQRFLVSAERIISDLEFAEKEAVGDTAVPQGHLTMTASVTFGRSALAPIVSDFLVQHPSVSVSVMLLDRVVNLVEEGIDIAVRIGPLPDSSLIAKQVGTVHRILVASPSYLAEHGIPTIPSDLRSHAIIAFTSLMQNGEWRYRKNQKLGSVSLTPRFEINDAVTSIQAAEAGQGITNALSYMVAAQIRVGTLVPILPSYTLEPQPVHLVHPHAKLVAPKIRAFIDFASPRLRTALSELA